jgi:hypothetical protein
MVWAMWMAVVGTETDKRLSDVRTLFCSILKDLSLYGM